uniref:NADH-ubiquinone oxidoreductase chain 4 n=1 Tax=Euciroa cf. queenslandica STW-2017 TaxID=1969321 RepID=A0A1U9XPE1_9BIVA|nr:NADH dehydrogenase subunit 4 [Euciroa cf. queenslandica STW-2017]AQZ26120.1 NADH dehydrogenase subunit 4 [Euciroa cf. queenslandica STW-2017]
MSLMLLCLFSFLFCGMMYSMFVGFMTLCMSSFLSLFLLQYSNLTSNMMSSNLYSSGYWSPLIVLTVWISMLALLASMNMKTACSNFVHMLFMLMFVLLVVFSSAQFFLFYMFFEMSLIPMLYLVLGWGYQPERLQATTYMIMYTVGASLPLLGSIIYMYYIEGSLCFELTTYSFMNINPFWNLLLLGAFFVKLPCFLVHLWLPKAHVEAPLAGSMLLAGVLLKLGGYGLLRSISFFKLQTSMFSELTVSFVLWGGLLTSFMCLRQVDVKSLIAYSSVGHMSLVLLGAFSCSSWGIMGSIWMMVAHGLCSSGLFACANYSYMVSDTRSVFFSKGMLHLYPYLAIWWFLLAVVNIGSPPSLNLMSEMVLFTVALTFSCWLLIPVGLMSFVVAAYSLYLYSVTQHGKAPLYLNSDSKLPIHYMLVGLMHWLPLNMIILIMGYL